MNCITPWYGSLLSLPPNKRIIATHPQPTHLREDKVEVAFKRMAKTGGIVVLILLEHLDEVHGHGTQPAW